MTDFVILKEFLTLAKATEQGLGCFNHAAEVLNITPSTLSKHIRQLEDNLGESLFERTTRRVSLTEFGRFYLPHAARMYDSYVESQTAVDQYLLSAPLTLHFGTVVPIAVDSCHIQAMRACEKIYPDCSFQLTEFDNWILKEMLRDNNMEFILAYQEQTGQNSFVSIPVQDDRLTAMVSTRHPYYHLDELSLDMLADQNIITSPRHSYIGNLVYNICRAANFTPHVWYSDNTNCDLANIIDHGGGIGLMMQSAANLLAGPHTKLIPLSCVQVQQLCIFYLKEHKLSPVAQLYLEELQRAIKQQQFFTVK